MKQVLQNLNDGSTEVAEVPCPRVGAGQLLIRTTRTLVSAGTERMLVDFGKGSFIDKARQQPDKVRMVLDKIRTDGLMPTIEAVRNKLGQPLPMGGAIDAIGPISEPHHYAAAAALDPRSEAAEWHRRRQRLGAVMADAGFARHPNEWWHFSHGDQLWAWSSGEARASYGRAPEEEAGDRAQRDA